MSLNCNEINVILEELSLEGCFVQDIIQPGYETIAFYVYGAEGAKTVLVSLVQNGCRINETKRKIVKNDKPLRFMEILRSRIKGSKIEKCCQLDFMRIVLLELSHGEERFNLYLRLWSGNPNIILCDEKNTILDSMFRRPKKGEVTGSVFVLPASEGSTQNAAKWPVRDFSELKERLCERTGSAETGKVPEYGSGKASGVSVFCRAALDFEKLSFNQKVDLWYSEEADSLSRKALLEQAEKWYQASLSRLESALEKLEQKLRLFEGAEKLKHQGDLILSNSYLWDGVSNFLECEDYEIADVSASTSDAAGISDGEGSCNSAGGRSVRILMNPKLSAQENAALLYENYKKQLSGKDGLLHDIEITQKKIQKLKEQYLEILNEKNPIKIEQLLRRDTKPKQQQKKAHPGLDYTVGEWYILVGRDANENDELLRHHVRGNDMWLHVRDFPGGYVFIKARNGKTVPLEVLLDAANLAVYYSKARNNTKVDLYYTEVKYLRRAKNGPKGLVLPTHEKNLCVTPDKKRLERLEEEKI